MKLCNFSLTWWFLFGILLFFFFLTCLSGSFLCFNISLVSQWFGRDCVQMLQIYKTPLWDLICCGIGSTFKVQSVSFLDFYFLLRSLRFPNQPGMYEEFIKLFTVFSFPVFLWLDSWLVQYSYQLQIQSLNVTGESFSYMCFFCF